MDGFVEQEYLPVPVIPPGVGAQHVLILPCNRAEAESGEIGIGVIFKLLSLHENRVRVHVDSTGESEGADLGVVGAVLAFDDLSVLVLHRSTAPECRHTVLGVVVEVSGAESILLLVLKLDQGTAELGQILIDEIIELVAAQNGLVLDDADIAECLYEIGVDIPDCSIADQESGIVVEAGISKSLPVAVARLLDLLEQVTSQKTDQAVCLLLGEEAQRRQNKCK